MHSFCIAFAYLLMIFLPCAVAEWGYLLTAEWWQERALARQQEQDEQFTTPLNQAVATGFVAAKTAQAATAAQAAKAPAKTVAPVRRSRPAVSTASSHDNALRVAERLAALMEIHRLVADGLLDLPLDQAMKLAAESPLLAAPQSPAAPARKAAPAPPPMPAARAQRAVAPPPAQRVPAPAPPSHRPAPPAPQAPVVREQAPAAAVAPPAYRPAPPPPLAPAMASSTAIPTSRQPVRPPAPISTAPSRVSEDVYARYGFEEAAPEPSVPESPAQPPHESSGEISVAA